MCDFIALYLPPIYYLFWPIRSIYFLEDVLSSRFNLAVSLLYDRRSRKACTILLLLRVKRRGSNILVDLLLSTLYHHAFNITLFVMNLIL